MVDTLYPRLGYIFRDPALLTCALTHRSADQLHNERLEFLGDAVLNLVIGNDLFLRFPQADEGELSRLRAQLVKGDTLGKIAVELHLGEVLRLGSGELKSGGFRRQSILADAVEAIIGAIYLDGGLTAAQEFIKRIYASRLSEARLDLNLKDPKTRLQEYLQARGLDLPSYDVVHTVGHAHAQIFEVACRVVLLSAPVHGSGSSRRKAEQAAAQHTLELLHE
ncbi:MAG: ribonuclease III [Gammaproteobacteria bacterium]|nr:ribonuclease III [Gammaproteobacteria bacterium]